MSSERGWGLVETHCRLELNASPNCGLGDFKLAGGALCRLELNASPNCGLGDFRLVGGTLCRLDLNESPNCGLGIFLPRNLWHAMR